MPARRTVAIAHAGRVAGNLELHFTAKTAALMDLFATHLASPVTSNQFRCLAFYRAWRAMQLRAQMPESQANRHAPAFIFITMLVDTIGLGIIIPVTPKLKTAPASGQLNATWRSAFAWRQSVFRHRFRIGCKARHTADQLSRAPPYPPRLRRTQ